MQLPGGGEAILSWVFIENIIFSRISKKNWALMFYNLDRQYKQGSKLNYE